MIAPRTVKTCERQTSYGVSLKREVTEDMESVSQPQHWLFWVSKWIIVLMAILVTLMLLLMLWCWKRGTWILMAELWEIQDKSWFIIPEKKKPFVSIPNHLKGTCLAAVDSLKCRWHTVLGTHFLRQSPNDNVNNNFGATGKLWSDILRILICLIALQEHNQKLSLTTILSREV